MKLHIKNMVCNRCKIVVQSELKKLGLHPISIELGEIEIREADIDHLKEVLIQNLKSCGLDLMDDKQTQTIEKIKTLIIDIIQNQNSYLKTNLSDYLTQNMLQDYGTLSHLFSDVEGMTIQNYFIIQKIEKVKELISYNELNFNEIAELLHYSSPAHMSNQFKKVTGVTPSFFKDMKIKTRESIANH